MSKKQKVQPEEVKKARLPWTLIGSGVVLALLLVVAGSYALYYRHRYLPHTEIAGVQVGGMTQDQALEAMNEKQHIFLAKAITVTSGNHTWQVKPADIGTTFDNDPALNQVWTQQKVGNIPYKLKELIEAPFQSVQEAVDFTATSGAGESNFANNVLQTIETPYQEVSLAITADSVSIVDGKSGEHLDSAAFQRDLYAVYTNGGSVALHLVAFQPQLTHDQAVPAQQEAQAILAQGWTLVLDANNTVAVDPPTMASWLSPSYTTDASGKTTGLTLSLNQDAVKKALDTWSSSVNQPAVNAQLAYVNNQVTVTQDGTPGKALDENATIAALSQQILHFTAGETPSVTAVIATTQPQVSSSTLASLGLTQRIGTATTDFTGSPANRTANIKLGQQKLDGTLVEPGQTYSTIGVLGPVTEQAGFLDELVIKGNRTVPDAGGGLCQVSTTLFRAVLNAGLPVVERQNHSYRVGYYERGVGPGLDATIFDPAPDFKWKNDMTTPVYVESSVSGNTITFDLYGTSDGRVSTIGTPDILSTTPAGNPIYVNTDTLPQGKTQQIETPHDGAVVTVSYTVVRDGQTIDNTTFRSDYKPWPAQYEVGTGPAVSQ